MTHVGMIVLVAIGISMVCSLDHVKAEAPRQMSPKAAQQFAADTEKAASGDPDAAYRMGEAFESGRLGGVKGRVVYQRVDLRRGQRRHRFRRARTLQQPKCDGQ